MGYLAEGREGSSPFSTKFKMTQKQPNCWGGGNERAGSGMAESPCPVQPSPDRFSHFTLEGPQLDSSRLSQRTRIWLLFLPHSKTDGNPSPKHQVLGSATAFQAPLDHPGSAGGACCGSSFVNPGRRLVLLLSCQLAQGGVGEGSTFSPSQHQARQSSCRRSRYAGVLKEVVSSLDQGIPRSILSCLKPQIPPCWTGMCLLQGMSQLL